jgi:NAD+ synthase (glutamine-hydrolysing)
MRPLHVAAASLNQTPLDWAGNERRIAEVLESAREAGVALLCLPELALTGYGCEDAFLSPSVQQRAWAMLERLLPRTRGLVVGLGLPVAHERALYNVVAVCVDGQLVGLVPKQHLAGDGLHYEPRWFKPWPSGTRVEFAGGRGTTPMGDLLFEVGGVRIGFEICEDAWVANRPGAKLAVRGAEVILNPSASHFAFGKFAVRKRFVLDGSRAFQGAYVYANHVGNEAGRAIYDGGALIAHAGRMVAVGPRFSFQEHGVTSAVLDLDEGLVARLRAHSDAPQPAEPNDVVRVPYHWPDGPGQVPIAAAPAWETGPHLKEEEFARAVALGLFDYGRKSGTSGFIVSLSGGADSSAIAALVKLMVSFGRAELGEEALRRRWPQATWGELLLTAYQSTENSGPVTREAARVVAGACDARHLELDVDALVKGYRGLVEGVLGRPLGWATDDVALQNVQARVRAPSVWLLANVRGALLLSTSNRSEAAVGYATMDGDTAGGLAPIAGIDKAYLRRWLRWLETTGPEGIGPLPALRVVNVQAPTAELRPPAAGQTDEGDLMPYELLDRIERLAVRDLKSPAEVLAILCREEGEARRDELARYVRRFFRLFARNQWKRERYAPSFHVDDESLDPRGWFRFPILSGGFEQELTEL